MGWLKKLRTSRGFGVHSPFAFYLITGVIRQKEAQYYAYQELDALCEGDYGEGSGCTAAEARLLLRLVCHFRPGAVMVSGVAVAPVSAILKEGAPHALRLPAKAEAVAEAPADAPVMVIADNITAAEATDLRALAERLSRHPAGAVLAVRGVASGVAARLWNDINAAPTTRGMDFSDGRHGLLCMMPGLPRQSFSLYF